MEIGIVGLPNVGKSTLFNALLKKQAALAANYPFATIEPNVGVVPVPDRRLNVLADLINAEYQSKFAHKTIPEKITPSTIIFNDIAGLVEGAHKGEGLGNQFLAHIREVDAIVHVVRAFEDDNVVRSGSTNPKNDIEIINTELILMDYQIMEKRVSKLQLDMKRVKSSDTIATFSLFEKVMNILDKGELLINYDFTEEEQTILKGLNLLTYKPVIYLFNVSEDAFLEGESELLKKYSTHIPGASNMVFISAKIESELHLLEPEEREIYMEELGIKVSGIDKVISHGYSLLGLQTFLTAGPKEVRSWTIKKGTKAPQAAGKIHTDFEKGFIAADVVDFKHYAENGSWKATKDKGLARVEGKGYTMQDGDVVEFRINV